MSFQADLYVESYEGDPFQDVEELHYCSVDLKTTPYVGMKFYHEDALGWVLVEVLDVPELDFASNTAKLLVDIDEVSEDEVHVNT